MDMSSVDLVAKLNRVTASINDLNDHYKKERTISHQQLEALLPDLQDCNQSLGGRHVSKSHEIDESVKQLLKALQIFPFTEIEYDKEIQEQVNAVQLGLLSTFIQEVGKLELRLKKWKASSDDKIKGTFKSKTS